MDEAFGFLNPPLKTAGLIYFSELRKAALRHIEVAPSVKTPWGIQSGRRRNAHRSG